MSFFPLRVELGRNSSQSDFFFRSSLRLGSSIVSSSPVPGALSTASSATSSKHKVSSGLVVGLVVGIGLPLLLFLAFLLYKLRTAKKRSVPSGIEDQLTPFEPPQAVTRFPNEKMGVLSPISHSSRPSVSTSDAFLSATTPLPSTLNPTVIVTGSGPGSGSGSSDISSVTRYQGKPEHAESSSNDRGRVQELQEELERARRNGSNPGSMEEIQAMRRDLQQLMHIVGRSDIDSGVPPPEYGEV